MSLYADYVREREGKRILETSHGFATFKILGKECYIEDIYVSPEFRKHGEAAQMASSIASIAKSEGCTVLTGSVCPTAKNSTESLKVLLSDGFKLLRSELNLIWFFKEIL